MYLHLLFSKFGTRQKELCLYLTVRHLLYAEKTYLGKSHADFLKKLQFSIPSSVCGLSHQIFKKYQVQLNYIMTS